LLGIQRSVDISIFQNAVESYNNVMPFRFLRNSFADNQVKITSIS